MINKSDKSEKHSGFDHKPAITRIMAQTVVGRINMKVVQEHVDAVMAVFASGNDIRF